MTSRNCCRLWIPSLFNDIDLTITIEVMINVLGDKYIRGGMQKGQLAMGLPHHIAYRLCGL